MKKIIDGRLYNTDTARCIGERSCYAPGDYHHFSESLYQKTTGEFFLHGEGGPLSPYAVTEGSTSSSGRAIVPLSLTEAEDWISNYLGAEVYISLFGEPAE